MRSAVRPWHVIYENCRSLRSPSPGISYVSVLGKGQCALTEMMDVLLFPLGEEMGRVTNRKFHSQLTSRLTDGEGEITKAASKL